VSAVVRPVGPTGRVTGRLTRRAVLRGAGSCASLGVLAAATGCRPAGLQSASRPLEGGWVGADVERGHLLREGRAPVGAREPLARQVAVLIVGGGIAGLACARALRRRGIDDVHLLELEDTPGGNSRGHSMGGMACPLGAHYLPVPDERDPALQELLAELGLSQQVQGRWVYDERHLCHSPQERLFIGSADDGHWHEGLLPPVEALPAAERAETLATYRRFAALVTAQVRKAAFAMPTAQAGWSDALARLDALTFAAWLDAEGLRAPALRWYLDYCCRDDYGGGLQTVSAWAGLHYFASRHGFHAPGDEAPGGEEGVLTWPEGNAWLARRLAEPQAARLHTGRTVWRVDEGRHGVTVDAWDHASKRLERWSARQVVLATPLFIAARLLARPDPALHAAAAQGRWAPWLVANLQLDAALNDPPGAPPSWDNVIYRSQALGYVDAMHQATRPHPGPTVLSAYWALGGDSAAATQAQRSALLTEPWQHWAERTLAELSVAHPDLRGKLHRIDLMRYGHAMSMPVPGVRGSAALQALQALQALPRPMGRISIAHADLSGYSVFEEAFFHGHRVGQRLAV
jgi:monoamine oxidase